MRSLLLLPLLLGFSGPIFAHNEPNIRKTANSNCTNLVAHNILNNNVGGAAGCAGPCKPGDECKDAFGSKYVCCSNGNGGCQLVLKEVCEFGVNGESNLCRSLLPD